MVRNLITGPGFVASHLADYLLEQGEEVYITARWTDDKSSFDHIKDKVNWIPMDLNDLSSCIKAIEEVRPDYIFHLGAQSYVSDSFIYPAVTIQTNTLGTLNLLEAVRLVRDRDSMMYDLTGGSILKHYFNPVVHVCSSSEVYGQVTKDEVPIKETNQFRPANPYAVGKVGEDMIAYQYWKSYGLKIIRTRMFTHTGPRRKMMSAECNFARQIARIELGLQEPVLGHGNLDSIRTWADVRDAVRAYYVLVRECTIGEVYNIGGDTTKSIGQMLQILLEFSTHKRIKLEEDPSLLRKSDVTLQIPDCSKFKNETGWEPTYSFDKTMYDLLEWWRKEERKNV